MEISSITTFFKRLTTRKAFVVREHFTRIYERNLFKGGESCSGKGSTVEQTVGIRRELPSLIKRHRVTSFLDAPCGDCNWIAKMDWSRIRYTGVDVVQELVVKNDKKLKCSGMHFDHADLCTSPLPNVDLIFCRDCWVHLDFRQISECLSNFKRSGSRLLLTTTFPQTTRNRELGRHIWRPLNLQTAPFFFPEPLEMVVEGCTEDDGRHADKALGLWRLEDIT